MVQNITKQTRILHKQKTKQICQIKNLKKTDFTTKKAKTQ